MPTCTSGTEKPNMTCLPQRQFDHSHDMSLSIYAVSILRYANETGYAKRNMDSTLQLVNLRRTLTHCLSALNEASLKVGNKHAQRYCKRKSTWWALWDKSNEDNVVKWFEQTSVSYYNNNNLFTVVWNATTSATAHLSTVASRQSAALSQWNKPNPKHPNVKNTYFPCRSSLVSDSNSSLCTSFLNLSFLFFCAKIISPQLSSPTPLTSFCSPSYTSTTITTANNSRNVSIHNYTKWPHHI